MTQVIVQYSRPSQDGPIAIGGAQRWTATKRRSVNGTIILPSSFRVEVPGTSTINIDPTGPDWAWRVDEFVDNTMNTVYVLVPDQASINFADLIPVDPDTFESLLEPQAAWYGYVTTLETQASNAVLEAEAAKASASLAQIAASGSATSAGTHASNAATSASAASSSASSAATHATNAGANASDATIAAAAATQKASEAVTHAGNASAAATQAQGHATTASGHASTATAKANEAVTSAGLAQDAADFADSVSRGFTIGVVSTGAPGSDADADITGSGTERKLDLVLPRGAIGPATQISIGEVETGPETPGIVGPQGIQGLKGDPGGIVQGASLGGSDLNLIVTPGVYAQTSGANVTTALNYPANTVGDAGVLLVTQWGGAGQVVQQYTTYGNPPTVSTYGVYIRTYRGSWTPWTYLPHSRVDQTAGRAIYQWDDLNNRDQLIYGDTGWRNIDSLKVAGVESGPESPLSIRRHNQTVWLRYGGFIQTSDPLFYVPSGFRPSTDYDRQWGYVNQGATAPTGDIFVHTEYHPPTSPTPYGMKIFKQWRNPIIAPTRLSFSISFNTSDPWPTTLPGTAIGTIPNV